MITLVYNVDVSSDLDLTVNIIEEKIPCFVSWVYYRLNAELSIECRVEDAAYVERMLAPFV